MGEGRRHEDLVGADETDLPADQRLTDFANVVHFNQEYWAETSEILAEQVERKIVDR